MNSGLWSEEEHDRFLYAIRLHPTGPWPAIAAFVGTRSVRQVQTHTQKYYEKIMRRVRGLRKGRRAWARLEHRIEDDILEFCKIMNGPRVAADIARQLAESEAASRVGAGERAGTHSPSTSSSPPSPDSTMTPTPTLELDSTSNSSLIPRSQMAQTNLSDASKTTTRSNATTITIRCSSLDDAMRAASSAALEESESSELRAATSEHACLSVDAMDLQQLLLDEDADDDDEAEAGAFDMDDDYDDGFFDLPSLDESLDFFIASLEHDSAV